jgi:hypothetical protein
MVKLPKSSKFLRINFGSAAIFTFIINPNIARKVKIEINMITEMESKFTENFTYHFPIPYFYSIIPQK